MRSYKFIGRTERIKLPLFELDNIEAKIDTGAYTSSIDCSQIELDEEAKVLRFKIFDKDNKDFKDVYYEFDKWEKTEVTSSNGTSEERFMIKVEVQFGSDKFETEFTLANRSKMKYPILIGRKTIPRGWFVDVHNSQN